MQFVFQNPYAPAKRSGNQKPGGPNAGSAGENRNNYGDKHD